MKKTPLIITVLFFAIALGGAWLYQVYHTEKTTPWNLIDNDAAMVIELTSQKSITQKATQHSILASIIKSNLTLSRVLEVDIFSGKKILISVHPVSADDFGVTVIIDAGESQKELNELRDHLTKNQKLKLKERSYNAFTILEFFEKDSPAISITQIEENLVICSTPLLMEGVVRMYIAKNAQNFRDENIKLFRLPTLQSDDGNIYLNTANFNKFLQLFMGPELSRAPILQIGQSAVIDLKIDSNKLLFNGFLSSEDSNNKFLSLFDEQRPLSFAMAELISTKTASAIQYYISDQKKWFEAQGRLIDNSAPEIKKNLKQLLSKYTINQEDVQGILGNGLTICYLDNGPSIQTLSIVELTDNDGILDQLSLKAAELKGDSVYHEPYFDYDIKMIDEENLFYDLFYPLYPKGAQLYFVNTGRYTLASDNVEVIKGFLDDVAQEDTWAKSVEWNKYLESTLQESTVNIFFDGRLASLLCRELLADRWRPLFDTTQMLGISKGAIQLSHLDAIYYLNSVLQLSTKAHPGKDASIIRTYEFDNELVSRAQIVKSHVSKDYEVLVQDSLNNLYLFSKDLKRQWSISLGEPVTTPFDQIDFYANGKLQYFFTTKSQLLVVDRLGRNVDNFPTALPKMDLAFARVVDYDRSKRYRYLFTDHKGNLYLTDKNGALLDGWKPRPTGGQLIAAANHYRIFGRDYFIAIQQNGVVHLMNRRGEALAGFPVSLGARPGGDYFLNRGRDRNSTYFVLVSEDGHKIQVDLDGKITRSDVLPRQSSASKFSLVKTENENSFVFFRVDAARLAIIDANGKVLFEVQNTGSDQWQMDYIQTDLKEMIFCLHDPQQNFAYFFNETGRSLFARPMESNLLPTMHYGANERTVQVFNVYGTELSTVSIKLD